MRIVLDATALLLRSAGVKTYIYELLHALRKEAAPGEIKAFPFLDDLDSLDHQRSVVGRANSLLRLALVNLVNTKRNRLLDVLLRSGDVFHASQHIVNPPRAKVLTATVFDMTCWLMPETHTPANVVATKLYAERTLQHADGLIAISERSRDDAMSILKLPAERFEVIYPGVSGSYFHVQPNEVRAARDAYQLAKPYLLTLGSIEPRKNMEVILDAYRMLKQSLRDDLDLVMAGPMGWRMEHLHARLESEPGVRLLGYVPTPVLPGLLQGAEALVYPSLYEGFGLPVAEAMAAGVPVITSNSSCFPETTAGAAVLVDPQSAEELSAAMERLLLSSALRDQLRAAGLLRAKAFTWDRCARESLRFFRKFHPGGDVFRG